jgi:hypothetical protein
MNYDEDWDTEYSFSNERRILCEKIFNKIDNYSNDSEGWLISSANFDIEEKYENNRDLRNLKNSIKNNLWTLDSIFTETKPVNIDDDDETQHNRMCLSKFNKEFYLTLSYKCKYSKSYKELCDIRLGNWF